MKSFKYWTKHLRNLAEIKVSSNVALTVLLLWCAHFSEMTRKGL